MATIAGRRSNAPPPQRIGTRYQIKGELGRGGMAYVYHAVDISSGREVALKQLVTPQDPDQASEAATLFEREFNVLSQLAHPRVIEVYDYGVDATGPYYTMELLDGGDLRQHSPLPWKQACELMFDVCSSLALLHSRRLVHRDISPRNIRRTRDGHAKLIDFGAMVPVGADRKIVGTPAFVAPEVVHRTLLDARTDLFSFGATLYFALTRRAPYPAREFANLPELWARRPVPASSIVTDIPPALDALLISLLSEEPAMRPRSAFEVMQRLSAIAGIERNEPLSVASAYLATPQMVGRDQVLNAYRRQLRRALRKRGRCVVLEGEGGVGRSRMLDACVIEAKLFGATVLRASGRRGAQQPFAIAQELAEQLFEAAPEAAIAAAKTEGVYDTLFEAVSEGTPQLRAQQGVHGSERAALSTALSNWLLRASECHPLVIAADDADVLDDASLALLATLGLQARGRRMLLLITVRSDSERPQTLGLLTDIARKIELQPLKFEELDLLLGSVFGDVPNLALLAGRVHAVCAGNPREAMAVAQYLVDHRAIEYEGGTWRLPVKLEAEDLPNNAEAAYRERLEALSPLALRLAQTLVLSGQPKLSRVDCSVLGSGASPDAIDAALNELLAAQVLESDGRVFALAHPAYGRLLASGVDDATRRVLHQALAELNTWHSGPGLVSARHLLLGDEPLRALEQLAALLPQARDTADMLAAIGNMTLATDTIDRALTASERLQRPLREQHELRRWLVALSATTDARFYQRAAPAWLERLLHDSGLAELRRADAAAEPDAQKRLIAALTAAGQRYASTPEAERVYSVEEAIRYLVYYVVISIAIGAQTLDAPLLQSLPPLLEPITAFSPIIEAVWQNAIATVESSVLGRPDRARTRWITLIERLNKVSGAELDHVEAIRNAMICGVGMIEAYLGLSSASAWADALDHDPLQAVNALYVRKIVRLQQGDIDGAERYRRHAELMAAQAPVRQLFPNTVVVEMHAHTLAGDLTGVKQAADRIATLATRFPGWRPHHHLARGHFERLRGNAEAALNEYEQCIALCEPDSDLDTRTRSINAWPIAVGGKIEALVELGHYAQAQQLGMEALARCEQLGVSMIALDVARALALAQTRLGRYAAATARLEQVVDKQLALGVRGLNLGATFEARARIAIWAGDNDAVGHYGGRTAREYRHGRNSALGARYERLLQEARAAGSATLPHLAMVDNSLIMRTDSLGADPVSAVKAALHGASSRKERAIRALSLLCEAHGVRAGYVYLSDARDELEVFTTEGQGAPGPGIDASARGLFDQELDDESRTAILTETSATMSFGPTQWSDARGVAYHPVMLIANEDGISRKVGVAVLAAEGKRPTSAHAARLIAALSAELARLEDGTGVGG